MKLNFLRHKWQKIAFSFVLVPVLIVFIIALILNHYLAPILATQVREAVLTGSDSLYHADFTKAELHLLEGKVTIYNISLIPDTVVYNRKKQQHIAPNNLVTLHVKKLILKHIHPFSYYFRHKLNISQIILNEPELNVSYTLNHTQDTVLKDYQTTWQKVSKALRSISVGQIYFNDVKFKYEDYSGHKVVISTLKEMNLSATDLLIDSATQTDKSRLLYCKDIVMELNNYSGKTDNGLYDYKINYLRLSTMYSRLNIRGLQLQAAKNDLFFNKSQSDSFTLGVDSLQLNNFDFLNYHKYRRLKASSLDLADGDLRVFGNPNKSKRVTADQVSTFPNVLVRNTDTDLTIDTIRLKHIDVSYSEFNAETKKTGSVEFNNTSGEFHNVTTNKVAIAKNNITDVRLSSYFMNRGRLDVQFLFNLTDADGSFNYNGSLGNMVANKLNQATVPLAMLKITSGNINQFNFDIHANRKAFKGRIALLYNDLKVSILEADTANNRLKKQQLISIFANLFVIKRNNPDVAGKAPRFSDVNYLRPKDSPFFKTVWRTLLQGIKECAGLDEKSQQAAMGRLTEHKKNKQERLVRKAERKKRRADKKAAKEINSI
ncbi:hypothetical protein PQ469_24140 [Mucilaginibacter sp. KACC 22773]|uniref:hypothetical protein n=1 Tax=Mucilaginibacter sp. KACC 22773 TaxID=3025671 RepID=UPI002367040B|nr:hypothetical protein [Mucilaginibacter sp. KACC 22773]WDF76978.1 hypothetical protein PQ469_24140 [Mucilaginibacter sp. KACC 22773]